MKRVLSIFIFFLIVFYLGKNTSEPTFELPVAVEGIAELPVISYGREKPLDTVARSTMRVLNGRSTFIDEEGRKQPAIVFLLDLMFVPEKAARQDVFKIEHTDVAAMFSDEKGKKYFSAAEIEKVHSKLKRQYAKISPDKDKRSASDRAVMRLWSGYNLYKQVEMSFRPPKGPFGEFFDELESVKGLHSEYRELMKNHSASTELSEEMKTPLQAFAVLRNRYMEMDLFTRSRSLKVVSNPDGSWSSVSELLLEFLRTGELSPALDYLAKAGVAYRSKDDHGFRHNMTAMWGMWGNGPTASTAIHGFEYFYNYYEPFVKAMFVYIVAFFMTLLSWLFSAKEFRRLGYVLLLTAFLVHSFGMIARILIQGVPPVTNLYSSAIFIGWFCVFLGLFIEYIQKEGLVAIVSCAIGVITLIIAHNLSMGGDTMERMRAVLNSNFWLTTHVLTISIGYSATFVAGGIASVYLLINLVSNRLKKETHKKLSDIVYGVVMFSLLFSFIGTVTGGIWADVSWGRFWGWDPKENGALMIVLWNALILHARLVGWAKERSMMQLAACGNIVTAWSWFGTNMLGVGLHSYGFTESAYYYLFGFAFLQLLLVILPARLNFVR